MSDTKPHHAKKTLPRDAENRHGGKVRRYLQTALSLVDGDSAAAVLVKNDISRVIAGLGTNGDSSSFRWPGNHMPYNPVQSHIVRMSDGVDFHLARAIRTILGDYRAGTLIRVPIRVEPDYALVMLLFRQGQKDDPSDIDMQVLHSIAEGLRTALDETVQGLITAKSDTSILLRTPELITTVRDDVRMRVLLNNELKLIAFSEATLSHEVVGLTRPAGTMSLFPRSDMPVPLVQLLQNTLNTGVTAPEVEMISGPAAAPRVIAVKATPVRPIDSQFDMLDLLLEEHGPGRKAAEATRGRQFDPLNAAQSASSFLLDSLVRVRSIRARKPNSIISLRSWRLSLKRQQILALDTVRRHGLSDFASVAGAECAQEFSKLASAGEYKFVVPVPEGHADEDLCVSSALARAFGAVLGLPVISAFTPLEWRTGPKDSANRRQPKLRLTQLVPGPAILIDAVAMRGTRLAEAQKLLQDSGTPAFAMAYVGGEAK